MIKGVKLPPKPIYKTILPINSEPHGKMLLETFPRFDWAVKWDSYCIIDYWNALPDYVVKAPSTNSFKARLDKHWKAKKWDDIKANRR